MPDEDDKNQGAWGRKERNRAELIAFKDLAPARLVAPELCLLAGHVKASCRPDASADEEPSEAMLVEALEDDVGGGPSSGL